jgi:hypothetical protein
MRTTGRDPPRSSIEAHGYSYRLASLDVAQQQPSSVERRRVLVGTAGYPFTRVRSYPSVGRVSCRLSPSWVGRAPGEGALNHRAVMVR